jgi:Flp pilus assembly protein TadG
MAPLLKRFMNPNASAAIEFGLVAPVIIVLIAGIVEFGRIFVVYNTVNRLATQYAIAWSDCSDSPIGACLTELSSYTASNAIANFVPQLNAAKLTLQMFQISMSGTTPTVVYSYPSGSSLTASQISLAKTTFTSGQSAVIVTATYAHSLTYFPAVMTPFLGSVLKPSYTALQLK